MTASGSGKVSTTKLLLDLGANRTLVNSNRRTAKDLAANADVSALFVGMYLSKWNPIADNTLLFSRN